MNRRFFPKVANKSLKLTMLKNSSNPKNFRLFWDIDGTLIRTNGAAATPFKQAISNFIGEEIELDRKKLSGFTDFEIIHAVVEDHGINLSGKEIEAILEDYSNNLPTALQLGNANQINVISQVLSEIQMSGEFENAIATGNCKLGAVAKLTHINLIEFFEDCNIFHASIKSQTRDQVIAEAKKSLTEKQIGIVIGDSPKDIFSAKANNLKVLGVATGMHDVVELRKIQDKHIVENNWTKERLIQAILEICYD